MLRVIQAAASPTSRAPASAPHTMAAFGPADGGVAVAGALFQELLLLGGHLPECGPQRLVVLERVSHGDGGQGVGQAARAPQGHPLPLPGHLDLNRGGQPAARRRDCSALSDSSAARRARISSAWATTGS